MTSRLVRIGMVGKAHGLRGHFFVDGRSNKLPAACQEVIIAADESTASQILPLRLMEQMARPNGVIFLCEGFESCENAAAAKGKLLWANREFLGPELIWSDFYGKKLVDVNGSLLGTIDDVVNFGANDSLHVVAPEGPKKVFIPLLADYVDFALKPDDPQVKLRVDTSYFSEFWYV